MAESSSDDSCAAPTDFDISSSLEDSNGKVSVSTECCPLCAKPKRAYYCKNCIRDGEFVRSTPVRFPESFSSKKVRLREMTRMKQQSLEIIDATYSDKVKADQFKTEIAACHERIRLLKVVLKDSRSTTSEARTDMERSVADVELRRRNMPLYFDKVSAMQKKKEQFLMEIKRCHDQYEGTRAELHRVIRENVNHLVKYIFPIMRVKSDDSSGDSLNEDTVTALAEASRTAYIRGRWVYSDNSQDCKYKIVESVLPSNGDYSAYNDWVVQHRDSVPSASAELSHRNAGSAISAGLTCVCQLVAILAYFLDIWLPKKLCYSEFCSQELNEQEFACKVAKLNANVLHLCLSQTVDPDRLHPRHTVSNLLLLLNPETCRLGWHGAFEFNPDLMRCMEESLLQDLDTPGAPEDDGELQEELDVFGDWETVATHQLAESPGLPPRVTMSAMPSPGAHSRARQSPQPADTTMSVTGGLVSAAASVASWWRAAIGHK